MIIPVACFTCGKTMGHLWAPYVQLIKEYNEGKTKEYPEESSEYNALAKLNIERVCCRTKMICHKDMYMLIS
jgi:DNA-directed RNA polymerase subunit N (RpoN/RPB10)